MGDSVYTVGDRLKHAMAARRITATELAKKLGVSKSSVSNWMAGKGIGTPNLRELSKVLEVDYWWLATGVHERDAPVALATGWPTPVPAVAEAHAAYAVIEDGPEDITQNAAHSNAQVIDDALFCEIYKRLLPSQREELVKKAKELDLSNKLTLATLLRTYGEKLNGQ